MPPPRRALDGGGWRAGMNGATYGEVGIGVASEPTVGFTHTVFDLLSPDFYAGASDCAGPGTDEFHSTHAPCPATFRAVRARKRGQ